MLNCHKLQGEFTKIIAVETNDPQKPNVNLTCKGKILEALKLDPASVHFGRLAIGQDSAEKVVRITRGDGGALKPVLRPINESNIEAELREIEPGEKYELAVRVHVKPTDQRINGRVTLETGIAEQPTADVNIFGTITPRITAQPATVIVPGTADTAWSQNIEIRWADNSTKHKLTEAQVNHDKLAVNIDTTGAQPRVVLRLKEAITGNIPANVQITVATDDPQSPVVNIPVRYRPGQQARHLVAPPPRAQAVAPGKGASSAPSGAAARRAPRSAGAEEASPGESTPESTPVPE